MNRRLKPPGRRIDSNGAWPRSFKADTFLIGMIYVVFAGRAAYNLHEIGHAFRAGWVLESRSCTTYPKGTLAFGGSIS